MCLLLSSVILGELLVKVSLFNCKVKIFMRRQIVLVVKSKFNSILGLGFSKHTHMMIPRGARGSPVFRFVIQHSSRSRIK